MNDLICTVADCGDQLLCGVTVLLACGSLAVYLVRKPLYRQRLGEILVAGTLLWLAVALVPMRRAKFDWPVDLRPQPNDLRQLQLFPAGDPEEVAESRSTAHTSNDILAARARWTANTADVQLPTSATLRPQVVDWTSSQSTLPLRKMFSIIYLLGAFVTSVWLLFGRLSLFVTARRAKHPAAWLIELYESLDRMRDASVLITKRGQPMSFGALSPKIILPAAICQAENLDVLRYVLCHEQVHVDRRDACGHFVLNLAMPFLYFHPFYWWIRSQVTFCRELIADDQSCEPRTKAAYVDSLVRVLRESASPNVLCPVNSLGVFRSPFSRRMKMLIDRSERLKSHTTKSWTVYTLFSMVLGVATVASVFGVENPVQAPKLETESIASAGSESEPRSVAFDDSDAEPPGDQSRLSVPATIPADEDERTSAPSTHPDLGRSELQAHAGTRSTTECVISGRETNLAFSSPGILKSVEINEGDEVTEGQLIARLDDEEASHRLSLAISNYEIAKSRAESKIRIDIAKTTLELAALDYRQAIEVNKRLAGSVTASEIRTLRFAMDQAAFELAQSREDATVSAKEALAKYELVKIAKNMLSARRLVARSQGVITNIQRNPGSFANEGDTICTMIQMQTLYIEGQITKAFLSPQGSIQPKLPVTVYPGNHGEGVVTTANVISMAHGNDPIRFRAAIKNSRHNGAWLISPGMKAVVRFTEFRPVPASPDANVARRPAGINSGLLWGGLPSSASGQAEVVAAMQEMADFAEEHLARVHMRFEQGAEGGEAVNLGAARYFLHHAKGQLAVARQDSREAREQMEKAVAATADWFAGAKASYELGAMDIAELHRAAAARAAAKYWLATLHDLVGE